MNFDRIYTALLVELLDGSEEVDVGEWHAQDVRNIPALVSNELMHVRLELNVPETIEELIDEYRPNMPWAEEHFLERVSGQPLNPPPSHVRWPFGNTETHMKEEKFSHTYPERYWPKAAGKEWLYDHYRGPDPQGIRYAYGDLNDLVNLLVKNPMTRQAYLPVWFPEDLTAANLGERVPCSIGYHFLIRNGTLHCEYTIRSCDWVRHFRDDMYLTARLMQWVRDKVSDPVFNNDGTQWSMGDLIVNIGSLHYMTGDRPKMEAELATLTG